MFFLLGYHDVGMKFLLLLLMINLCLRFIVGIFSTHVIVAGKFDTKGEFSFAKLYYIVGLN
jgi:hypothetical protein